jgi:hypothetical protein
LTTLTPTQQLDYARERYESLLAMAQGGDADAAGKLQDAAQEYLEIARDIFASSGDYTSIFDDVRKGLGLFSGADDEMHGDRSDLMDGALPTNGKLASQTDVQSLETAVRELTTLLATRELKTNDPQTQERLADIQRMARTSHHGGVLMT